MISHLLFSKHFLQAIWGTKIVTISHGLSRDTAFIVNDNLVSHSHCFTLEIIYLFLCKRSTQHSLSQVPAAFSLGCVTNAYLSKHRDFVLNMYSKRIPVLEGYFNFFFPSHHIWANKNYCTALQAPLIIICSYSNANAGRKKKWLRATAPSAELSFCQKLCTCIVHSPLLSLQRSYVVDSCFFVHSKYFENPSVSGLSTTKHWFLGHTSEKE